jgi:hypothetical protein
MFEGLGIIATGMGELGSKLRFADIDGGGVADYSALYDQRSVKVWGNTRNLNKDSGNDFKELNGIAAWVSAVSEAKCD